MGSIKYRIQRRKVEAHREIIETDTRTFTSLEATIGSYMRLLQCPRCSNRRLSGKRLAFVVDEVDLFREQEGKDWLGRTGVRDYPIGTVWNLAEVRFELGWNSRWGHIRCHSRGCGFYTGVRDDDLEPPERVACRHRITFMIERQLGTLIESAAVQKTIGGKLCKEKASSFAM